jgi:NAD(P) transhydrogenase subunit alpha
VCPVWNCAESRRGFVGPNHFENNGIKNMIAGIPKETYPHEARVALLPMLTPKLAGLGLEVIVQSGAGSGAGIGDVEFEEQGARIAEKREEVFASADILLQVRGLGANPDFWRRDLELLHSGQLILGFLNPLGAPQAIAELSSHGVTALALELLPRISRAQPMDALTSMATIVGYKAVLLAANALPRIFPLMMTASGTMTPARVFVVGAGVAGLQAIATARRLGATVDAYDVRPSAAEEVESLGAKFLSLPLNAEGGEEASGYARPMDEKFYVRQREMMSQAVAASDVVITTAAVPGRKAPMLVTGEMIQGMRPGSVIVDVAAEAGGNCELTRPGENVQVHGVTIMGPVNLPSTVPYHSSQMYANNVVAFLGVLLKDGQLQLNMEDPIIHDTLVTQNGEVVNIKVQQLLSNSGSSQGGK